MSGLLRCLLALLLSIAFLTSAVPLHAETGIASVEMQGGVVDVTYDGTADVKDYDILYVSGDGRYRALIGFNDLTGIPQGATVTSARLMLYKGFVNGTVSIAAHAVLREWDEAEASPELTMEPDPEDTAIVAGSGECPGYVEWDITPLVAEWKDGTRPNNGVMLVASGDTDIAFSSSETLAGLAQAPKLKVEYALGPLAPSARGNIEVTVVTPEYTPVAGAEIKLFRIF